MAAVTWDQRAADLAEAENSKREAPVADTLAPERIWVRFFLNGQGAYVMTSEPDDIDERDIPFVHADLHATVVAERDQLKAKLTELEKHSA